MGAAAGGRTACGVPLPAERMSVPWREKPMSRCHQSPSRSKGIWEHDPLGVHHEPHGRDRPRRHRLALPLLGPQHREGRAVDRSRLGLRHGLHVQWWRPDHDRQAARESRRLPGERRGVRDRAAPEGDEHRQHDRLGHRRRVREPRDRRVARGAHPRASHGSDGRIDGSLGDRARQGTTKSTVDHSPPAYDASIAWTEAKYTPGASE